MKPSITDKERRLLVAIRDSDYHDGRDPIDDPVWTEIACDDSNLGTGAGGVMASLVAKGLAYTTGHGREDTCWITEDGMAALKAAEGKED
jgi:hypothetical protein